MTTRRFGARDLWRRLQPYASVSTLLTILTLLLIAVFHAVAAGDRLLLNLYYLGIASAAYALVRRRALANMSLVLAVTFGTTLAQVYFSPKGETSDPLLTPVMDFVAWCVFLLLCWRLGVEAYTQSKEQRLQLSSEIEERNNAMRAAALTCTSHEVRTPLTGILSFTEMLLDESAGSLNELQRDFVSEIEGCSQHLMALVNDILDYAKAQSGQIKLASETVALQELVAQCVGIVEARAAKSDVQVVAHIDPAVREINADPLRLKQILLNLLSNAVKYSPAGGMVRIQVRATDREVIFTVRDTGAGIEPQQINHLFDPYYQASQTDRGIGTGLGLAITKLLVDLHAGSISIESAPGSGSLFTVRLPRGKSCEVPGSSATTWQGATKTKTAEKCGSAA